MAEVLAKRVSSMCPKTTQELNLMMLKENIHVNRDKVLPTKVLLKGRIYKKWSNANASVICTRVAVHLIGQKKVVEFTREKVGEERLAAVVERYVQLYDDSLSKKVGRYRGSI